MRRLLALTAGALGLMATQASAQTTTYYVHSAPYATVSNYTACPHGGCTANYSTSQRLSGSFTILGALGPNLVDEVVDVRLGDLDLGDGQNTFQTDFFSNWNIVAHTAQVSTDSNGNLTYFEFKFDKMHGVPVTVGDPNDAKSYVTSVYFSNTPGGGSFAYVRTNSLCTTRGDNVAGNTAPPGYGPFGCDVENTIPAQGASQATAPSVTMSLTPPPPPPVPTLSEWAMILFGGLLAGFAALTLRRRLAI